MKNFLKLMTCLFVMTLASASFAQTAERTEKKDKASELTAKLSRNLTLSAEQTAEVKRMATDYFAQVDQLRTDEKTFADKKKVLDANYEAKLKEVLTAEQWTKYEAYKAEQQTKK